MNTKELIEELRSIDCTWPENNAILEKAADRIENLQDQVNALRDALEKAVSTCFTEYAHHQVMSDPTSFINEALAATEPKGE